MLLDFRNNVIHDSMGYSAADPVRMNYIGNYVKPPRGHIFKVGGQTTRIYVAENYLEDGGERNRNQWDLISGETEQNQISEPFSASPVATDTALRAYQAVISACGATLPRRDAVDDRVMGQLQSGTGGLINSQKEVQGWPELRAVAAPPDADQDGMPDAWETKYGLDPQNRQDAVGDLDRDGYTNVEEFLNGTDPSVRDVAA